MPEVPIDYDAGVKEEIRIQVKIDPEGMAAIVRKTVVLEHRDGSRRWASKHGLNKQGQWQPVDESKQYPDECLLPILVTNRVLEHLAGA